MQHPPRGPAVSGDVVLRSGNRGSSEKLTEPAPRSSNARPLRERPRDRGHRRPAARGPCFPGGRPAARTSTTGRTPTARRGDRARHDHHELEFLDTLRHGSAPAPPTRESPAMRDFGPPNGETRTRTGDTTIFRQAARTLELLGNPCKRMSHSECLDPRRSTAIASDCASFGPPIPARGPMGPGRKPR